MARNEKRSFLNFFNRKTTSSAKPDGLATGPGQPEEGTEVMKSYSNGWFGGVEGKTKETLKAELKKEVEAPPVETPLVEEDSSPTPEETPIVEESLTEPKQEEIETVVERKFVGFLKRIGLPVAFAAAACAAVLKLISSR
eukprot:g2215.t2